MEGKAVTLGAGNFVGGVDVAVGLYDVTAPPGQSGTFSVENYDNYFEALGAHDGMGVSKMRVRISRGDTITISDVSQVIFTPVSTPLVTTHSPVTLYAGTWTVGQDLGPGRYLAAPAGGQSGNFLVPNESVDAILGPGGVPNVSVSLKTGDVISIENGLDQVTMTPT